MTNQRTLSLTRLQLLLAFFGFIVVGAYAGAWGVQLPSLSSDYHLDKSIVGLLFFSGSIGYCLSAISSGTLIQKLGLRGYLMLGTISFLLATAIIAAKPPFAIVLITRLLLGFGMAVIEAGLNIYITLLPRSTHLMNYLHAFFGAGALLGPLVATTLLALSWGWNIIFLIWSVLSIPLLIGFALFFKNLATSEPTTSTTEAAISTKEQPNKDHTLIAALKLPIVWLASLFLFFYVGIEMGLGNWGYSFLIEAKHNNDWISGLIISGYWLGLTLGRFVSNHIAEWLKMSMRTLMYPCMVGIIIGIAILWLLPGQIIDAIGFCLIGFSLASIYPNTVALVPRLVPAALVSNVMGLLIGISTIGIALLPWLAGVLAEYTSLWSLLPYVVAITLIMFILWWAIGLPRKSIKIIGE